MVGHAVVKRLFGEQGTTRVPRTLVNGGHVAEVDLVAFAIKSDFALLANAFVLAFFAAQLVFDDCRFGVDLE